jgi:hypothetical protein
MRSDGINLFESAITAAHAGGQNEQSQGHFNASLIG